MTRKKYIMNPILIHLLNGVNYEECANLIKGLILFWWFILMPTTITAIFIDQFNIIYNKAIIQANDAFPKLVNHWKNPFYHFAILVSAMSRIIFIPMNLLLAYADGKEKWWNCL